MPTKKRKAPRRDDTDDEDWEPNSLAVILKRGLMSPISPAASKVRRVVSGNDRILNYADEIDSDEESIICLGGSSIPNDDVVFVREHRRGELIPITQESSRVDALFKALPIEIHQHITKYFPSIRDVTSYALVCKKTGSAITASVWRQRFVQDFDMAAGTPDELARKYAFRMGHTKEWTCFDLGKYSAQATEHLETQKKNRRHTLGMLRDLILESNAYKVRDNEGNEIIVARNFQFICDLVTGVPGHSYLDIIQSILNTENNWDPKKIIMAKDNGSDVLLIQLCLTSISLDPKYCNHSVSHFDLSQAQVYCTPSEQPLFGGDWRSEINVRWLLHAVNFFKLHLKAEDGEGLLGYTYSELESDQLPQPWLGHIQPGTQQIGSHWKGVQTFIRANDLTNIRSFSNVEGIPDEIEGPQLFQDLTFFFNDDNFSVAHWPKKWEDILIGDAFGGRTNFTTNQPKLSRTRASLRFAKSQEPQPKEIPVPKIKHFYGTSRGSHTAHFFGRLQALPAQGQKPNTIHGFQRITMMKFYTVHGAYDPGETWAYEGCVLPGGRIIVGRWWEANVEIDSPDVYSGPFMFWNVDRSTADPSIDEEEALDFLTENYDQMLMV